MDLLFSTPVVEEESDGIFEACLRPIFERQPNLQFSKDTYNLNAKFSKNALFYWTCLEFKEPIKIPYIQKTYRILVHCYKCIRLSEYSSGQSPERSPAYFTPEWYDEKSRELELKTPLDPNNTLFIAVQWKYNMINAWTRMENNVHNWAVRNILDAWVVIPGQKLENEIELLEEILNKNEEMNPKIINRITFLKNELKLLEDKEIYLD